MYRVSSISSNDLHGGDDEEYGIVDMNMEFPAQIRKPPKRHKLPSDRLHLAVWNDDCDQIHDLVINRGIIA
jgi:hypothetical protein